MNINLTLIGQMISFFVFMWFCMKYVWPPLIKAMEERQANIAAGLRDAEKANEELKKAKSRAEGILSDAKDQAAVLIEAANKRSNTLIEDGRDKAQSEAERIKAQASAEVVQQLSSARETLSGKVSSLAILGAERILEKQITRADHDQLLAQLSKEL